jgi:hypothetical protein
MKDNYIKILINYTWRGRRKEKKESSQGIYSKNKKTLVHICLKK